MYFVDRQNIEKSLVFMENKLNILETIITLITLTTIVSPPGIDFFNTFKKKLPFILFLFGSKARINAGIPIVIELTKLSCIGWNG